MDGRTPHLNQQTGPERAAHPYDTRDLLTWTAADDAAVADRREQEARREDLAADARDRANEARHERAARRAAITDPDNAMLKEFWSNRRPTGT